MGKRLFDVVGAALALIATAPLLALAALGITLASPGPVLYRAARRGRGGRPFTMLKLRTMHQEQGGRASRITATRDPRVFPFGALLRRLKIDELPQLLNVLRGEMSIVGPRPEDPELVTRHYAPVHWETLAVRPGLASPGSIYNATHGARLLEGPDPERRYLESLLPLKLALDLVYVRRASLGYDLAVIGRTLRLIAGQLAGRTRFPDPPELAEARALVVAVKTRPGSDPDRERAAPRPGDSRGESRHGEKFETSQSTELMRREA